MRWKAYLLSYAVLAFYLGGCMERSFPGIVAGNPDVDEGSYQEPYQDPADPEVSGTPANSAPGTSPDNPGDDGSLGGSSRPDDPEDKPESALDEEDLAGGDQAEGWQEEEEQTPESPKLGTVENEEKQVKSLMEMAP